MCLLRGTNWINFRLVLVIKGVIRCLRDEWPVLRFHCDIHWYLKFLAQSVYGLATGWTVRGSNPCGGEIFRASPHRPCGPPSLLYNAYRAEWPGRGVDHPPPSRAEVNERVDLYLFSPSVPSWPVLGWTWPLTVQGGDFDGYDWVQLDTLFILPPHGWVADVLVSGSEFWYKWRRTEV